ncbi:hypothetical protein H0H92_005128 [Tricholoma furcatifolium]|nr:hypothetical protein H0H92_005128 [Tricholoma furcatifolium]
MPKTSDKPKIPRPPNAFIIYRSQMQRTLPPETIRNQPEVSRIIGGMWRSEPPEVKARFEERAALKKREHEHAYPGYKYAPRRKEPKNQEDRQWAKDTKGVVASERDYHSAAGLHDNLQKHRTPTPAFLLQANQPVQYPFEYAGAPPGLDPSFDFYSPNQCDVGMTSMAPPNVAYYLPYLYSGSVGFSDMGSYAPRPSADDEWNGYINMLSA